MFYIMQRLFTKNLVRRYLPVTIGIISATFISHQNGISGHEYSLVDEGYAYIDQPFFDKSYIQCINYIQNRGFHLHSTDIRLKKCMNNDLKYYMQLKTLRR